MAASFDLIFPSRPTLSLLESPRPPKTPLCCWVRIAATFSPPKTLGPPKVAAPECSPFFIALLNKFPRPLTAAAVIEDELRIEAMLDEAFASGTGRIKLRSHPISFPASMLKRNEILSEEMMGDQLAHEDIHADRTCHAWSSQRFSKHFRNDKCL